MSSLKWLLTVRKDSGYSRLSLGQGSIITWIRLARSDRTTGSMQSQGETCRIVEADRIDASVDEWFDVEAGEPTQHSCMATPAPDSVASSGCS
jgi:hypothetical protein